MIRLKQWVCVRRGDKIPWNATKLAPASVSDESTWSDYEQAVWAVNHHYYDGVGFVFNNTGIVGIDIDCGYDEDGIISDIAEDILTNVNGYSEFSRSGRGFHIFVKGVLPFDGMNNQKGVEIYQNKRYFIMTGKLATSPYLVEDQKGIDYVLKKYFMNQKVESPVKQSFGRERIYNPVWTKPQDGRVPLRPVYPEIRPGSRNVCLLSLGGMLHSQGFSKRNIYQELSYCNTTACKPPLDDKEVRSIVNSVTRYER